MRVIFASVLLRNETQRESARGSILPECGWVQNGGEGMMGDLRVRRTSAARTIEETVVCHARVTMWLTEEGWTAHGR